MKLFYILLIFCTSFLHSDNLGYKKYTRIDDLFSIVRIDKSQRTPIPGFKLELNSNYNKIVGESYKITGFITNEKSGKEKILLPVKILTAQKSYYFILYTKPSFINDKLFLLIKAESKSLIKPVTFRCSLDTL